MPDYDAIIKAVENDKPLPKNVIDIPDVKESHTSYINCMQELNERIAQLTELVNTGTDTLESLKETLKTVEKERDRLADQRAEVEPRLKRVEKGEIYFSIVSDLNVIRNIEGGYVVDNNNYNVNNYFYTQERAKEVADKINFLLKLERLHDIYCPDYVPDWDDDDEYKYTVYYDGKDKCYGINKFCIVEYKPDVVFPTSEIAQKVCNILNEELEEKK